VNTLTPSHFGPFNGNDAFQLPIPGLFADVDDGSASVTFSDEFLELPAETRARIIQRWGHAISVHENAALVEMFREFAEPLRDQSIVQQIEHFRQHCSQQKIACPRKLPVLLQSY
jgi:hypothetical protein